MPTRRKGGAHVAGKVAPPVNTAQYQGTKRGGSGNRKGSMKAGARKR
jgi:hypothetical protein